MVYRCTDTAHVCFRRWSTGKGVLEQLVPRCTDTAHVCLSIWCTGSGVLEQLVHRCTGLMCASAVGPQLLLCIQVGGYFGVAAGISGLYIAFAELFNEVLFTGRVSQTPLQLRTHSRVACSFWAMYIQGCHFTCA